MNWPQLLIRELITNMKTYLVLHKDDRQSSNATTFFLFRYIERRKDDERFRQ